MNLLLNADLGDGDPLLDDVRSVSGTAVSATGRALGGGGELEG